MCARVRELKNNTRRSKIRRRRKGYSCRRSRYLGCCRQYVYKYGQVRAFKPHFLTNCENTDSIFLQPFKCQMLEYKNVCGVQIPDFILHSKH